MAVPEPLRNEGDPVTTIRVPTHQNYPDLGRNEGDALTSRLERVKAWGYQPHYLELVRRSGRQGRSLKGIARDLDATLDQVIRWMEMYVPFRLAVQEARENAQAWWEDRLEANALAGDTAAIKYAMNNRFPDEYKDRREVDMRVEEVGCIEIDYSGFDEVEDADYEELPDV